MSIGDLFERIERYKDKVKPWLPRLRLGLPRWHHFNFIMLHYIYLISLAIIGSIIIYPARNMRYIDSLFFASGSATQSGLNTVDINKVLLYQQITFMIIASITNPIFINTFVVFIRLYWFEKRFQNVVHEARTIRRTRTRDRSRTKSEAKADQDLDREERGVDGRQIVVLRNADGRVSGYELEDGMDGGNEKQQVESSSATVSSDSRENSEENSGENSGEGSADKHKDEPAGDTNTDDPERPISPAAQDPPPAFRRDIVFADEIEGRPRRGSLPIRIPIQRPAEEHIRFVQNQRDPKAKETLRIPGPRDFDRGDTVQRLDEDDEEVHALNRQTTSNSMAENAAGRVRSNIINRTELNWDDHLVKEEESPDERPQGRIGKTLSFLRLTKSQTRSEPPGLRQRARTKTFNSFMTSRSQERDPMPYLSYAATIGRNSTFVDLTEEQREELGGIEYRSLKTLAIVLIIYYVGFHLFGMVCLLPWINSQRKYATIVKEYGISPTWWGFFTPASLFNDLGYTLTPDSMISFQTAWFPLLLGTFLIIIGNTGFPCMLRFIIWTASKCVPYGSAVWEELRFLLDHPRRCFTLLFPAKATWWLFGVLVLLNVIDIILFVILDLNTPTFKSLPPGYRFLDGLFQAASTRTAGFACVSLSDLHPAIQVSYLIMMYISVFPIAISVRRTNVYEEKSLGIYAGADADDDAGNGNEPSYIGAHLRRQLSFDLWYVFLGLFLIAIIEGNRIQNANDYAFTTFSILFEIVSAYGTVGLSLGYPGVNTSFSGEFHTLSKLIIIAMQIRGRHRGLPYALDRAILLPSESLHKKEQEEAARRLARRNSMLSEVASPQDGAAGAAGAGAGAGTAALHPTPSGPLRRVATTASQGSRRGLTKILTGALSAGPTHRKERKY